MYLGEIVEIGPRASVFANPQHAYTKKLLSAVPVPDPSRRATKRAMAVEELMSPIRAVDYQASPMRYQEVAPQHIVAV
jgi:peptide/nickel transport system ATP-binding protein